MYEGEKVKAADNAFNMYKIYSEQGAVVRVFDLDYEQTPHEFTYIRPFPEKNWFLSGSYLHPQKRINTLFVPPNNWKPREYGLILNPTTTDIVYAGTCDMWSGFCHNEHNLEYMFKKAWKFGLQTGRKIHFHCKRQIKAFLEKRKIHAGCSYQYYPTNTELLWDLVKDFLFDDEATMFSRSRIGEYIDKSHPKKHGYDNQHFYWNEVKVSISAHDILGIFHVSDDPNVKIPMDILLKLQKEFHEKHGFWIGVYRLRLRHCSHLEPENHQWKWSVIDGTFEPLEEHSLAAQKAFEAQLNTPKKPCG